MKTEQNSASSKDRDFEESRKLLNGKAIDLRQQGKGKRKNKADALTQSEEEQLWTRKALGGDTPQSINHTVYFTISQHFGTRGCQEHHQLQVQDFKFVCDPQTEQTLFVEWVEGPTKTCQGGLTKMDRRLPQKMFATGDERCPVKLLEKLISVRPPSLKHSGPLYLRPFEKPTKDVWFSTHSVGINKINSYVKDLAKLGGLDCTKKHFTNHSICKTTVRKLQKAGISNDKLQPLQIITTNSHYETMRWLTHKTISILIASKTCAVPLPVLQLDAFQQKMGSSCPQYNFSNHTAYINNGCSSSSTSQLAVHPVLKRLDSIR